jgi:DNA segregation ATPase FtsK/SpoIIIE-like protein
MSRQLVSKSKARGIADLDAWVPNRFRQEAFSILVIGIGLFTLVSLLSYHPADSSLFSLSGSGPAQNACGRVGAWIASVLLQTLGMSAFLSPIGFVFAAIALLKQEGGYRALGSLAGMGIAALAATVFLSQQWKYFPFGGTLLLTGGFLGEWVTRQLAVELNQTGTSIVAAMVFGLAIALATPISVVSVLSALLRWLGNWSWRFARLAATYLFYLSSVFAMRAAHFAGDLLQKMIEASIARARTKAQEKKQALANKESLAQPEALEVASTQVQESVPSPLTAKLKTQGLVTVPARLGEAPGRGADEGLEDGREDGKNEFTEEEKEESSEEGDEEGRSAIDISELRTRTQPATQQISLGLGPQILPREDGQGALEETGKTLAKKVNQKPIRTKSGIWKLPTTEFLRLPPKIDSAVDRERLIANSNILAQKFKDFGIEGEVTAVRPGPVITLYEFKPGKGVKVSRIAALADDLSMALSAQSVRILAPLPGKAVVGIEIPSETRENVFLREFLQHADFFGGKHQIPVVMGKDIGGIPVLSDLARMPHLLCAGQTGSGKSVFMNGLICSLLYRFTPDELRLILVDPKFIEFRAYQDIPHLLLPVVDDPKQAAIALRWAVREMERRYRILAKIGARNLLGFNQKVDEMGAAVVRDLLFAEENQSEDDSSGFNGSSRSAPSAGSDWIEAFEPDETGAPRVGKLPNIVIIIDELADLMMIAKKEVEISIARIAQKARAAGIHLVIATQRPSTDVVTGLIKANLPSRVSFQLASFVDSKTILDRAGAERLLGQGDMLFIPPGVSQTQRLQGAFVEDDEIHKIASFLKAQGKPAYRDEILLADDELDAEGDEDSSELDPLFDEAVELIKRSSHASASFLQRHLKIGYNRAARLIECMEERGIVSAAEGGKPREILLGNGLGNAR